MCQDLFAKVFSVEDPRLDRKKQYPLDYILLIVFIATLSGCSSWYEIEDYSEEYHDELRAIYQALRGLEAPESLPTHDTLNRCISLLSPQAFEEAYRSWLEAFLSQQSGRHICIDGKTMRGVKKLSFDSSSHVVSAYSPRDMSALAQVYIDHKSNEIPAIKQVLSILELEDTLISIDAIGTQTSIAEEIVSRGGHYVLCLKGNQSHSLQEVEALFCPLFEKHIHREETTELSHGRIETRRYESILNPLEVEENEILSRWFALRSVHKVTRIREDKKSGKRSEETSYYISSSEDLPRLRQAIRGHWAIENQLHYCLDVFLGQDVSHKRVGNVAQIMDIIQKINLFIIQRLKQEMKTSIPRLQKKLARLKPKQIIELKF